MNQTAIKRFLIPNLYNLRDLGGYMTEDGRLTAWKKLYRSDGLSNLTAAEWDILKDHGIRTVVDLRSLAETRTQPDAVPEGIDYFHCPVQKEEFKPESFVEDAAENALLKSLSDGYLSMVKQTPELFCAALGTVIRGLEHGAVLFHCSAGKDRTGVTAAALLYLLGVGDEDIIADYQVSNTYNRKGINRWMLQMAEARGSHIGIPMDKVKELLGSDPAIMELLLDCFRELKLEEYLLAHGLIGEDLNLLRKEMTVL